MSTGFSSENQDLFFTFKMATGFPFLFKGLFFFIRHIQEFIAEFWMFKRVVTVMPSAKAQPSKKYFAEDKNKHGLPVIYGWGVE